MARVHAWTRWLLTILPAATLGYAGLLKINDPSPASDFVVDVFSVRANGLVRAAGFAELALAVWLVSGAARRASAFVAAALFVSFAVVHAHALNRDIEASCGCLGSNAITDSIPTWGWIVANGGLALVAVALTILRQSDPALNGNEPLEAGP